MKRWWRGALAHLVALRVIKLLIAWCVEIVVYAFGTALQIQHAVSVKSYLSWVDVAAVVIMTHLLLLSPHPSATAS